MIYQIIFIISIYIPITLFAVDQNKLDKENIELSSSIQQAWLPKESDLVSATLGVNYNNLTFDIRYNYEDRNTSSFWIGHTFDFTNNLYLNVKPMLGLVTGDLHGMAPGLELDFSINNFGIYTEIEYIFDFDGHENNFSYSWSEITYQLYEHLTIGILATRTRYFSDSTELDRGPLITINNEKFSFSLAALNIDSDATVITWLNFTI